MGAAVKSLVGAAVVALVVSVLLTPYGSSSRCGGQLLSRCVSVFRPVARPSLIRRPDVSSPQTPEPVEVDWGAGRIPL